MDADRWTRVNELFQATIERATEERSAFLAAACGDDGDLREQVRAAGPRARSRGAAS
jgi:hypothetical protein